MANVIFSVGLEVRNEIVRNEIGDIISAVPGFHVQSSSDMDDCDILIMEIGEDFKNDCQIVNSLLCTGSIKDIFLVSGRVEPEMLLQAMRSGAREFFPLPVKREDIINALTKFRERNKDVASKDMNKKKGKIINIIGSKGGIGTTTIAANFAISILGHDPRKSVALVDMNLLFGEIPLFLDIESAFHWGEIAKNISRLDSTYLMSILSRHQSGLYILPSPTRLDGVSEASPGIIEKILRLMKKDFDYVVIDSGHSLDEITLKVLELSDTVLINSILSLPCLINVKRLIDTFKRLGYPADDNVHVIVNRYHKNSVISLKDAEKGIGKRIFWQIPNDFQNTISAINQGKTLLDIAPKTDITQNIRELAAKCTRQTSPQKEKKGILGLNILEAKA